MDAPAAASPAALPVPPIPPWYERAASFVGAHVGLAEVVLCALLLGMCFVVWQAQKRSDFDFAKMLKDETGKESALNFGIFVSLATSTWVIISDSLAHDLSDSQWWGYLAVWSGARVAVIAAQRWNGELPWTKK